MKSVITLVVEHREPIPLLADLIAQRAYTLDKVEDVEVVGCGNNVDLIALPVLEMGEPS